MSIEENSENCKTCEHRLFFEKVIYTFEKAEKLWGDDFDSWYDRYIFNINALNDYETADREYGWHNIKENPEDLPSE